MTDARSTNALRAVEVFLATGTPVSQDIVNATNAAYAAYAAYAAANATYATYSANANAANAANASASNAAYAAYASAYATANDPNIYNEKMRGYLIKLKEIILLEVPVEESSWLLGMVI
jgi:hypothetical protein